MARPQKKNADYFPHYANARNSRELMYLESKFGIKGYALYFKMMELIAASDDFKLDWTEIEIEIYSKDFNVKKEVLNEFIEEAQKINFLQLDNNIITSQHLIEILKPLTVKRKRDREYSERAKQPD